MYTEYVAPARDEWTLKMFPVLKKREAHGSDRGNRDVETRASGSSRGTEQTARQEYGGAVAGFAKDRIDLAAETTRQECPALLPVARRAVQLLTSDTHEFNYLTRQLSSLLRAQQNCRRSDRSVTFHGYLSSTP